MQNLLYAEHEMIFFKEGILGSKLFKKMYLLSYLKNELTHPEQIIEIDSNIRNLKLLNEDPFIIAVKIDELNRKKESVLHINLHILIACNLKMKNLKKTFRWRIYNFIIYFQDQVIFGNNAINSHLPFVSDSYFHHYDHYLVDNVYVARRINERRVLGGFMSHRIPIEKCSELKANNFDGKDHQLIFKVIVESYEQQSFLGLESVADELEQQNNLQRVGGKHYLIELCDITYWYSEYQNKMNLKFIKSISNQERLKHGVRNFIDGLYQNKSQMFIIPIEEWLNENFGNVEIQITRSVVF